MKEKTEISLKTKSLAAMSELEVIEHCGRLKYSPDKILSILFARDKSIDVNDVKIKLSTFGTREYMAYHSGIDAGDFEVESALYDDILDGSKTSVDSQQALSDIQSKRMVDDAIREKFFPDGD